MKLRKRYCSLAVIAIMMLPLGIVSCGDDDEIIIPAPGIANLRVLHLSPDAPAVDVYVNGSIKAVDNLAFKEGTAYLDILEGTYTFGVVATGAPPTPAVLEIPDLSLDAGKYYTAVAFDELASIQALALVDDNSNPGAGNIRVRAIHAASAVGQVDIWNVTDPDPANWTPLYEDVDFGIAGAYAVLPAANYKLGFDVNDDATPDLTFTTGAIPAGSIINIFAVSSGADVFLIAQFQDGTIAQIDPNP